MPSGKLTHLGNCIRSARLSCHLSQKQLADRSHLTVNTILKIEKGLMNPSYITLQALLKPLGLPADILFQPNLSEPERQSLFLIGKLHACSPEDREFIINMLNCMAEQLLARQGDTERNP